MHDRIADFIQSSSRESGKFGIVQAASYLKYVSEAGNDGGVASAIGEKKTTELRKLAEVFGLVESHSLASIKYENGKGTRDSSTMLIMPEPVRSAVQAIPLFVEQDFFRNAENIILKPLQPQLGKQ